MALITYIRCDRCGTEVRADHKPVKIVVPGGPQDLCEGCWKAFEKIYKRFSLLKKDKK